MNKLYEKSELCFSLSLIIIYVVGASIADTVSVTLGYPKAVTAVFLGIMSMTVFMWLKKNDLSGKYGLRKAEGSPKQFLYYIPLIILSSCNMWYGMRMNMAPPETLFYAASMVSVGFLEEIIFRGFLFESMKKDGVKSAIIVSSVTFGIGHIVNLINGSSADIVSNMCQVVSAVAFGFLFVIIFYRAKTLYPCIISHISINVLSAFANETAFTDKTRIINALIITLIAIIYTVILTHTLPEADK